MNTKMIVAVIIIGIVLVGGFLYINDMNTSKKAQMTAEQAMVKDGEAMEDKAMTSDEQAMAWKESMAKDETAMMKKDDKMMSKGGYVPYTASSFSQANGNRRVLYFYANWCPSCRPADQDLSANVGRFPEDVTVIRVNYNDTETDQDEKDLAKKYGITYQHTFVQIDDAGNQITKWNGGQTDELLANIK